ncbi:MAG TPA: rod shape-determining protein MreC [Edaphocola sp.]|nr:rod shape-determining protein MreC [Edaphocola sp.]
MVKIFQLIGKYWNIILFVMLEIFCLRLIKNSNTVQGNDLLNSSNALSAYFYGKQTQIISYFNMGSANKQLLAENTKLKNALDQYKYFDTTQNVVAKVPIVKYDSIKQKPTDTLIHTDSVGKPTIVQDLRPYGPPRVTKYASFNYIAAKVINNSVVNDKNNFITINRGTEDGVQKGMAVVSANGVVGRVAYVSKHYAAVISMLSSRPVSSQIANGNMGITIWDGKTADYVTMTQVDIQTFVKKGDTAYTTGYSFFPENIAIGTVTKIDTFKSNNTLNLNLKLLNNFRNLHYVYVVGSTIGIEKTELEKEIERQESALKNKDNKTQ